MSEIEATMAVAAALENIAAMLDNLGFCVIVVALACFSVAMRGSK